jgi:hypothetical protein
MRIFGNVACPERLYYQPHGNPDCREFRYERNPQPRLPGCAAPDENYIGTAFLGIPAGSTLLFETGYSVQVSPRGCNVAPDCCIFIGASGYAWCSGASHIPPLVARSAQRAILLRCPPAVAAAGRAGLRAGSGRGGRRPRAEGRRRARACTCRARRAPLQFLSRLSAQSGCETTVIARTWRAAARRCAPLHDRGTAITEARGVSFCFGTQHKGIRE